MLHQISRAEQQKTVAALDTATAEKHRAEEQTSVAESQRRLAEEQKQLAEGHFSEAQQQQQLAERERLEATKQRNLVEKQFYVSNILRAEDFSKRISSPKLGKSWNLKFLNNQVVEICEGSNGTTSGESLTRNLRP